MDSTGKKDQLKQVEIYTDGACSGNPGAGGYGVVLKYRGKRKELSGGFRKTTNNRMELLAAITGLKALKEPCRVTLYTDSQYIADAINNGWVYRWKKNGWMRNKKEKALNADLWEELLKLLDFHRVEIKWVRGHAGNPENERADFLATQALKKPNLPADTAYEKLSESG